MIEYFDKIFREWLLGLNMPVEYACMFSNLILFGSVLLLGVIVYYILKYFVIKIIKKIARKTSSKWDDILIENRVFQRMAFLVPALIIFALAPLILSDIPNLGKIAQTILKLYMVFIFMWVGSSFLNALNGIYQLYDIAKVKPIKGYLQVLKIFMYIIGAVIAISVLINRSPIPILTGMGVFSAIIVLIFKDTILGLVGSIQLSALDLVRPGDWIEMPKYNIDGIVIDMNLTTLKVRNWDMTIAAVPTYTLIAESFQNWRGMQESGGRRIKRSIRINMHSVKFCSPGMIEKFKKIQLISAYIEQKEQELREYNQTLQIDESVMVNGRRLTNLGVFRVYMMAYLRANPRVNAEMAFLVRQLQPTETGIPLEIYVFSMVKEWAEYETLQADIFDHILAVVPEFELEVFQNRTLVDNRAAISQALNDAGNELPARVIQS